jgi:beta-glucosidase
MKLHHGSTRIAVFRRVIALYLVCSVCVQFDSARGADGPGPAAAINEPRVRQLVLQMTPEEQLGLIHGGEEPLQDYQGQGGYLPGVPRLRIPSLRLADGPPGILTNEISASPPATMALAATFSVNDAKEIGAVVGRNARARGIDVVLQPYINIDRDPAFDRSYNTYGEDPLLTGEVAANFVRGVQAQNVMAQAKHFVAYDGGNDVRVDQQALHEIYLAPFEAVSNAGVASIMCSYNKINGPYSCANSVLLNGYLREQIGFKGFITSDWGATHGAEFIGAGLDMEMPGDVSGPMGSFMPPFFVLRDAPPAQPIDMAAMMAMFGPPGGSPDFEDETDDAGGDDLPTPETLAPGYSQTLKAALEAGKLNKESIRNAAARVLGQIERFGYLDGKQKHSVTQEPVEENALVLRRVAGDAAVLLKNDGVLPISEATLRTTLFIGPGAGQNMAAGDSGEKALGWPERQIGAVEALRRTTGATINYLVGLDMNGVPIPSEYLSSEGARGLKRGGPRGQISQDAGLNLTVANGGALTPDTYEWSGELNIPAEGEYNINLQILGATAELQLDGKAQNATSLRTLHGGVLQAGQDNILPTPDGLDNVRRGLKFSKGPHKLTLRVEPDLSGKPIQVRLAWVTPDQRARDRATAIDAAKKADTVVVFAWAHNTPVKMRLPGRQDAFIEDLATANHNTVVVLNTSAAVQLPWLPKVRAVLQMWYSGDEGGWATADVLTGKVSPAGRLPFTWPKRIDDLLTNDPAHPERKSGAEKTQYSEGIFVGYRWFDHQRIAPLFPFGYGLSYAHFVYSKLKIQRAANGSANLGFTLLNDGPVDGDEVPQVYIGAPKTPVSGAQFSNHSLAGFTRVHLKAGESKAIQMRLSARALQYWSTSRSEWREVAGHRSVFVGASSADFRLSGTL